MNSVDILERNYQINKPHGESSGAYTVTENGDYTFVVYDKLDNAKTVTETVSNIDKTAPDIVLSLDHTQFTNDPIHIKWQVIDNQSGVARVVLPDTDYSELTEGEFQIKDPGTYTFIAYDNVGNDRIVSIKASNVDMKVPKLTVTQKVNSWTNSDVELYYKAEDSETGIQEVVVPDSKREEKTTGSYTATKNGTYTFIAYDKSGNGINVQHDVSNIDKIIPELHLELSEDKTKIKWSVSDVQSGIDYIVLPTGDTITNQESGEFAITKKGTYTFVVYDKVGNYKIDKITI